MTPSVLMFMLVAFAMLRALFALYSGEAYVCPVCGTRDREEHADECPWKSR